MTPPWALVVFGFQKGGLKGLLLFLLFWLAFDYDCVCAHDAHDFSIDFFGKPMPS